jgi:hypothetical protein
MKPTPMPKKTGTPKRPVMLPKSGPVRATPKPSGLMGMAYGGMTKAKGMAYGGMADKAMAKPMGMAKGGMAKKSPAKKGKK